jgi:16S rRNA (uracil1498-N3)-methyltransferase
MEEIPPDDAPKHRFFLPAERLAGATDGTLVHLPPDIAHQLRRVLRLRPGARVLLLDGRGYEYLAKLAAEVPAGDAASVGARILERRPAGGEPCLHLTLYVALLKGQHLEWVLQKGTELGASAFVPIVTHRTVVRDLARVRKKRARWERILREAAEQCRRARVPQLSEPLYFGDACREAASTHEQAFLPTTQARGQSLAKATRGTAPERAALLIGPEGGFEQAEVQLALACGIQPVDLGPRTLRAETAALAATTILLERWGEMG